MEKYEHKAYGVGFSVKTPTDEQWQHTFKGKHGGYTGRRYRRGKNRCLWCGATNDAPTVDRTARILAAKEKMRLYDVRP